MRLLSRRRPSRIASPDPPPCLASPIAQPCPTQQSSCHRRIQSAVLACVDAAGLTAGAEAKHTQTSHLTNASQLETPISLSLVQEGVQLSTDEWNRRSLAAPRFSWQRNKNIGTADWRRRIKITRVTSHNRTVPPGPQQPAASRPSVPRCLAGDPSPHFTSFGYVCAYTRRI